MKTHLLKLFCFVTQHCQLIFPRLLKNTSFWIWNVDKGLNFYPLIVKQRSIPLLMNKTSEDGQYLPDHVHVILISDSDSNKEISVQSVLLINELVNRDGLAVTCMVIKIIDLVDCEELL